MVAWPSTLPESPFVDDLAETPKPTSVITFGTEVGPGKRRRRSTRAEDAIQATYRMSASQLATFRTFFDTTLSRGVLAFDMPDPFTGTDVEMLFDAQQPYSIRAWSKTKYHVTVRLLRQT